MNRTRMLVVAFLALALSVVVTLLAYRVLKNRIAPPDEMTQIVVAAQKLPLGTRLTEQQLTTVSWPKASPLLGSFVNISDLAGRGVITPIAPNEPILESKLAPKEGGTGLTSAIPEGMRAVGVKVNDVVGVSGFVLPGTRVDVIVVGSPNEKSEIDTSKVVLENVQVLAAGQNVEQDANGKPQSVQVVTLLVTPEDAQKLALASVDGRIQLALRNPLDLAYRNPAAVQKSDLYTASTVPGSGQASAAIVVDKAASRSLLAKVGSKKAAPKGEAPAAVADPPPPPKPRVVTVELIKGDKRENSSFEVKQR